ncbi:GDT1-like protein 2 [Striga asiatica]|uniref:GDT1-like protein 2 n=1 Tax=Striga asiatica TaxID=4170 RepID=A0A5A7QYI9_STRAF|nr:GDT1-like protein 2 [Striga asiatica]
MGALSLMTILSVIIGRIFHSVPAQFQTTLPIGEYLAVTLLMFFGLKSIKDAWDLPSTAAKAGELENKESDEFTEAEELVKEKECWWIMRDNFGVNEKLSPLIEVHRFEKAFQSPGAIVGHLLATSIAILGGAFLAKYIPKNWLGTLVGFYF